MVLEAYLIGSRARGDHLPYSDYDVVVVVPPGIDKLEAAERLRKLRRRPFPLDLIVLHSDEARDPLSAEILREEKSYARSNRPLYLVLSQGFRATSPGETMCPGANVYRLRS